MQVFRFSYSIWFLEEKSSLLCLCCVSSHLILALWNALNPFPQKGPNPWLHIGGYLEWELYKMPQERAYISSISFLLQVSSLPISIIYQSVLTTHPILWHGGGITGEMYHILTFCIVPLVRGKCVAFDIQKQIWQYKVKYDRQWRKLSWF